MFTINCRQLSEAMNMFYIIAQFLAAIFLLGLKIVALTIFHNFTLSSLCQNYPAYLIYPFLPHFLIQKKARQLNSCSCGGGELTPIEVFRI